MDAEEFQASTKIVSHMIVNYMNDLSNMNMAAKVTPGFLKNVMGDECLTEGSSFEAMQGDLRKIISGVTHRSSPHFHSDLPIGNSYPSMVAEILTAGLNNVSLNWEASPAATELEVIVLNWLAQMLDLPEEFHLIAGNSGGGVLQNTCSESILLSLLSARTRAIEQYRSIRQDEVTSTNAIIRKLVFYTSALSQTTADRMSKITTIRVRHLAPNDAGQVTVETLNEAFDYDTLDGLIPCMYIATMGSNALMSYDDLSEIGPWCQAHSVWLHVDADYSGMSLICPELRKMSRGIEHADSVTVGLHRLLISHDVVAYWIKEGSLLTAALNVDPLYLRHKHVGSVHDYMNWQVGTGRKFKALKVWMTMKSFGVRGMQAVIRKQVTMAQKMKELITKDARFEVIACHLGVVTFRLCSERRNEETKLLLERVNQNGKISLASQTFQGSLNLQFIANQNMVEADVTFAWEEIEAQLGSISIIFQ